MTEETIKLIVIVSMAVILFLSILVAIHYTLKTVKEMQASLSESIERIARSISNLEAKVDTYNVYRSKDFSNIDKHVSNLSETVIGLINAANTRKLVKQSLFSRIMTKWQQIKRSKDELEPF
jgi:esterase/lipase